ncbi:sigma-E factor negative regulatory protein [Psychromonas sp. KJ10-2]|uniref:sigma-E factor negative regulatory protein n=1 Tax=Psychromonas sp. KJ10-2 TaxID=3391822 RepID=UPI0039B55DDF
MMKEYSQDLSSLIDNEFDDQEIIDTVLEDVELQQQFSRYQLIGDVLREESDGLDLRVDVTDSVMAAIANEVQQDNVVPLVTPDKQETNVVPFMKRFGQYAIAASVAGVVVVSSLVVNQDNATDASSTPVLNTVPFGGAAAPVSLQATPAQTESDIKERNERLEALVKDHQLQLQTKP